MALSSRYALAVVTVLTPESRSFLRQLRTYASLISATVLETKCGYVAAEQVAIQPDGLRPEVGPLLEPSAYGASPQTR